MKHYGVLHGKYQDYSSIARKLLGQLKAQMDTTGQKFGSWNRKLSDGAILHISIIMNGAVPIYRAGIIKDADIEYPVPGLLWSGLAFPPYEDNYLEEQWQPTYWAGKTWGEYWSFSSFLPNLAHIAEAVGDQKPVRLHPVYGVNVIGKVPYQNVSQFSDTALPGSFSGKMREVVQRMLGAGQICQFRSEWDDCHWVFVSSDSVDWVIHFSDTYGLRAAKIPYIEAEQESVASGDTADYSWHEVLSLSGLSAYLATSTWSQDIGFAANTAGDEAVNLSFVNQTVSIDGYQHIKEWIIEISEGDVDGDLGPVSATITEVSDSLAWVGYHGGFRVPNGANLSTVWEFVDVDVIPTKPAADSFSWPVHVYFDGDTIQRFTAHFEYTDLEDTIPVDPKGATDADVWKANGADPYPYIDSFPVMGVGEFSLGGTITHHSLLYFSGPGIPTDTDYGYAEYISGDDTFALEPYDDASGLLVDMGGYVDGGVVSAACRYRTFATNGGSHTVKYALWIPNGERESVLWLERKVDISQSWTHTKITRGGHMFPCTGPTTVSGSSVTCCAPSGYARIQSNSGTTVSYTGLPAAAAGHATYSGGWNQPDGTCPLPWYQEPYVCDSQLADPIDSMGSFTETLDPIPAETEQQWRVKIIASGGVDKELDEGDDADLTYVWLETATTSIYDPSLYVNRTYHGYGVCQAMPEHSRFEPIKRSMSQVYLGMFKTHGGTGLWVGEPETY